MKVLVNLLVSREPASRVRETRRLAYLARIAHLLGHEVFVTYGRGGKSDIVEGFKDKRPSVDMLDVLEGLPFGKNYPKPDVVFCTHSHARSHANDRVVVAFAESLAYPEYIKASNYCSCIVCYAWAPEHYWNPDDRPVLSDDDRRTLENKAFLVPCIPNESTLSALHAVGLADAYCTDDVERIREHYRCEKTIDIGFYGHWEPRNRSVIANRLVQDKRLTVIKTSGETGNYLSGHDYLSWLSSCRLNLNLPGDAMACARFGEAAMLGVPNVCRCGELDIVPAVSGANSVVVDTWDDVDSMVAGLSRVDSIRSQMEAAYKQGWSLRGQFLQICQRLGLEKK